MKKLDIYRTIQREIISGRWSDGEKLPTEMEYAAQFGVTRDTIRRAFKMLEEADYIRRFKSKGTFVHLPETAAGERIIYLLVPCGDYLSCIGGHFQQILFALIAEAAKQGWGIVPVIFSRTNSPDDIWWENLARFNCGSKIVVNRFWFSPYFKTLAALGAKVAFINNDSAVFPELRQYTSRWAHFIEDDRIAGSKAAGWLVSCGCRKIALIMSSLSSQENTIIAGYRDRLRQSGLTECVMELPHGASPEAIRDFYRRERFDGLISFFPESLLPSGQTYRDALELPAELPVVSIPNRFSSIYSDPRERIIAVQYAMQEMAHDIVQYLAGTAAVKPFVRHYAPGLVDYGKILPL